METAGFWNAVPDDVTPFCDCCKAWPMDTHIYYISDKELLSFLLETDLAMLCDGCLQKAEESVDFLRFRFVQNGGVEA